MYNPSPCDRYLPVRALLLGRVVPQESAGARFLVAGDLLLPLRLRHGLLRRRLLLRLVLERALLVPLLLLCDSLVLARERGAHA